MPTKTIFCTENNGKTVKMAAQEKRVKRDKTEIVLVRCASVLFGVLHGAAVRSCKICTDALMLANFELDQTRVRIGSGPARLGYIWLLN